MRSLAQILQEIVRRADPLGRRLQESQALGEWAEAVGPTIAKHATGISFRDGVLKVEVDHPAWRNELVLRAPQILEKLNARIPVPVERLFFE